MVDNIQESDVLRALSNVQDPELGRDLVSLGMIKDLHVDGSAVRLTLELTTPACPMRSQMKQACEEAVLSIPGVESVDVTLSARVPKSGPKEKQPVPGVSNIIAVASGKGGVGKSTVSVNLAVALAEAGARVGLLDADIYRPSIPIMMGVSDQPISEGAGLLPLESHGVELMSLGFMIPPDAPVIWRGPMVMKAIQQLLYDVEWGELDYLVIDLPPGTGDAQLTLAQLVPVTGAVIVTTPQDVALADATKGVRMFQEVKIPILGIVENMSYFECPHCGERSELFSHGGGKQAAERLGVPFLGEVPVDPKVVVGGDTGEPIVRLDPTSPAAEAFMALGRHVSAEMKQDVVGALR
jgi:ATP-binding protein involved in chromosome partitioning